MVFCPSLLNFALMHSGQKQLELYTVLMCVHIWGCESTWLCTLVSIWALYVCHSPLKLQLPSRHDLPLCRNQQTSQHLTNMGPQLSLRLRKTSITLLMTCGYCFSAISHGDLTHTHTLNVQWCLKWKVTSPLVAASNETPHLWSSTSIHFCPSSIPLFFPIFSHSASPGCTTVSERKRKRWTPLVISGLNNGARPRKVANNLA